MNHIEALRQYNEWRRHDSDTDDPPAMPNPTEIGLAIDWAIGELTHWTTTDNTAVIRQLEREVDLLRDKYRTEQSLRAQAERHCENLVYELSDVQRLYERATRQAMEAQRRADRYRPGQAFLMIRRLVDYYWQNTCLHEETHRGGAIWEICSDCGAKWADDEGGRPENEAPEVIKDAELLIKMEESQ